jgi:hypothetical protein
LRYELLHPCKIKIQGFKAFNRSNKGKLSPLPGPHKNLTTFSRLKTGSRVGKRKQFIEFSRIKQDETEVSLDAGALGLLIAVHAV